MAIPSQGTGQHLGEVDVWNNLSEFTETRG